MKLSNLSAKLTVLKSTTVRALAVATLAGGAFISIAPAAHAQRFVVRAQIGTPRYFAPAPPVVVYTRPDYVQPAYVVPEFGRPEFDHPAVDRRDDFRRTDDSRFRRNDDRNFDRR
jgi:hypothetical protein